MTTSTTDHHALAEQLARTGRELAARGLLPATSGNLSGRTAEGLLITASGLDKGALTAADFLELDAWLQSRDGRRPSAETRLHALVYERFEDAAVVLHVHSPKATVLSRRAGDEVVFEGWEIQKAFAGERTHEATLEVPVVANDQDMVRLAEVVRPRLDGARRPGARLAPGFLIAGHGLYAWGRSVDEARRHLDAFEFLFECVLLDRQHAPSNTGEAP